MPMRMPTPIAVRRTARFARLMPSTSTMLLDRPAAPRAAQRVIGQAWRNGAARASERALPEEVPVAFSYGGTTHAVLMATPDDLEDFALGFSRTEDIIGGVGDLADLTVERAHDGIEL